MLVLLGTDGALQSAYLRTELLLDTMRSYQGAVPPPASGGSDCPELVVLIVLATAL